MAEPTPKKTSWYKSTWFTILTLVFFAPVGIFLTWMYANWSQGWKIAATAASTIFFVIAMVSSANAAPTLTIDNPKNDQVKTEDVTYRVSGTINGANSSTTITINNKPAQRNGTKYSGIADLKEGSNTVVVSAKKGDKVVEKSVAIYRYTQAEKDAKKAVEAKAAVDQAAAQAAAAEEAAAEEARRNAPKTTFGDGIYLVNKDIAPGTYRSAGGSNCYYERRSNTSADFDGIMANDNPQGQAIVTIAASDAAFKSQRCGIWSMI